MVVCLSEGTEGMVKEHGRKRKEYLALLSHIYSMLYTQSFTEFHDAVYDTQMCLFVQAKHSWCSSEVWDEITLEENLECRPYLLSLINNRAVQSKGQISCLQQLPMVKVYNSIKHQLIQKDAWDPFPESAHLERTDRRLKFHNLLERTS